MIDKIYHIADIHIRNVRRHKEYQDVFDSLYQYIENTKTKNSVIYLAGDIVHSKNEMTPELVDMVSKLFKRCAELLPTIIITGNHDTNLNNDTRLDALTPIVESLGLDNLYYWKDTGVYYLNDVAFSVFSIYNNKNEWIPANQINSNYKIALHHGAVNSAVTDLNHEIKNDNVQLNIFTGFDLALLGDIHKRQFLNSSRTVAYAGSLIQQSHSEVIDKGILVWDLATKKCEYVPFKNKFGFVTLEINSNKVITPKTVIDEWPYNLRLRVKFNNTNTNELNRIISLFKKKYNVVDLTFQQLDIRGLMTENHHIVLGDVRDVEYQNKLIVEYINKLPNSKLIDTNYLMDINRSINSKLVLTTDLIIKNTVWKPKILEFSNMFSYGENNYYDFQKTGLHGICGSNAVGKSSILDILTFCLYDKCTRTFKSSEILNNQKDSFFCKLVFNMGANDYIIERIGTKKKNSTVKVDVNFSKIDSDGTVISLNGLERNDTNKIIRNYIGSYDDFVLTALSSQNDNKNFVVKTQSERKDLLNSFLDISIFDELETLAKSEIKSKKDYIKILSKEISNFNEQEINLSITNINNTITDISGSCNTYKDEIYFYDTKINDISSKITNIQLIDINLVNSKRLTIEEKLETQHSNLAKIKTDILNLNTKKQEYIDSINEYNESLLMSDFNKYSSITTELAANKHKQQVLDINIKSHQSQVDKLSDYKFNPNCEYCINNDFVKSAKKANDELPELILKLKDLQELEYTYNNELILLKNSINELDKLNNLKKSLSDINVMITNNSLDCDRYEIFIDKLTFDLEQLKILINTYNQQEEEIKINAKYQKEIDELKIKRLELWDLRETAQSDLMKYTSELISITNEHNLLVSKKNTLVEITEEVDLYDVYLQAVSKNGIPYNLLQKILPEIEFEVNAILNQLVDFTLTLNTDDKNNINCGISYDGSLSWPVELSSGMERFIISIATRVALINVTSLSHPNFLAIDEGFGVLDSDNLNSLYQLFDYLKTQFDFILIITHIDAMKDFVDDMIFITKGSDGFSRISKM